jgi:predicted SnoaL-like aldol condensation-catalyzing enzyme
MRKFIHAGRTRARAVVLAAMILGAAVAPAEDGLAKMSADNRALVSRFVEQFYAHKDVNGAFETYVADNYIQHNPGLPDGRAAAQAALAPMFATAGAQFDVKHVLVDGNLALIHLFGRGDPNTSGASVVDLYRLHEGRVVEHWDVIQPIAPGTDPLATTVQVNEASPAQTRQNRLVMEQFIGELYRRKQVALAYQNYVAADFIEHSPGRAAGRDAAIAALTPLFAGADASFTIKHVLVDGNLAAVHYRGHLNAQSPGAAVVEIFRLQGGKIVEHWDAFQPIPTSSKNPHPMF